ncbi:hypothetical protein FACS1894172_18000 [Spirochaetia bacterium]|nr:hypothetical protein FACS1894172_18000 [Spirochaetia bacterium]
MNRTEEFVENIYLEVKKYINDIFNNDGTYVSERVKELKLNKYDEEKFKNIISTAFDDIMITLLYGFDGEAGIGNAIQQCYKIYDEENNLIYSPGELEVETYEYFQALKYENKNKKNDIIGTMKYTKEEQCEDTKNYEIKILDNNIPVEIDFFERKIIFYNEVVRIGIKFKSLEKTIEIIKNDVIELKKKIKYNKGFEIIKDKKIVGEVKVMEIINEKLFEI